MTKEERIEKWARWKMLVKQFPELYAIKFSPWCRSKGYHAATLIFGGCGELQFAYDEMPLWDMNETA